MKNCALAQETAPALYVETNGVRFAYRNFGASSKVPLIFFQHFIGNIDDWDPAITNEMAKSRNVILFNNTGVASTNGETPDSVAQMAKDAVSFINALNITKADILGYSLGGFIAQQMAITAPGFIRKMILAGTAPQGSVPSFLDFFNKMKMHEGAERFLFTFFSSTGHSRSKGMESLKRIYAPSNRRDSIVSNETIQAQAHAIHSWGTMKPSIIVNDIKPPTLVINGSNDEMLLTINSYKLFQEIQDSLLFLYPDSAHGALFQYPDMFVEHCNYFLDKDL